MVSTALIRDYIVNEEKTYLIREAIAAGASQYGMQTFDQSLFHLLQSGLISMEEALHNASNADEFRMRTCQEFFQRSRRLRNSNENQLQPISDRRTSLIEH